MKKANKSQNNLLVRILLVILLLDLVIIKFILVIFGFNTIPAYIISIIGLIVTIFIIDRYIIYDIMELLFMIWWNR